MVRGLVGLERALVLAEGREHLAEQVLQAVLLAALALAALLGQHLGEGLGPLPLLGAGVFGDERHGRVLVVAVGLEGQLVGLHREVVLAEHLVAQLAELDEQLGPRARRLGVHLLLIEVAGGAIPVGRVDGDDPQRGEGREVGRIEIQRHLVALLRLHAVAELLVELLADAEVHLDALLAVGREVGDARHVLDGLGRIVLLLVELGEGLERGDEGVVEVDDVEVGVDRAIEILHLVRVDLGRLAPELDLLLAIVRGVDVPIEGVDEIVPLTEAPVAALEGLQGLLVRHVDLDHLLQADGGEIRLEELLLLDLGDLQEHVDALALGGDHVELHLEDAHEVGPLRGLGVDALQAAHREQALRVELEHLAVDLAGLLGLEQGRLVEAAGAELDGGDRLGIGERFRLAAEDLHEVRRLVAIAVDALQRLEGGEVELIHVEGALVEAEALIDLAHALLEHLAHLGEHLLAIDVGDGDVEGALERLALLLPGAGLLEEARHLPEHGDVVRVERQDLLVVRLRVLGVAEVLRVPLGEAQAERDLLERIGLLLEPGVDLLHQLGPAVGRLRHPLEVADDVHVGEVHLEGRDEGVEGLLAILELLLEDLGHLAEDGGLLLDLLARLQAGEVELDQRLAALRRAVQLFEGEEGAIVRRIDLEDLLVGGRALVLLADLVLPDLGDLEVLADALRGVLVGLGAAHLDVDHLGPALLGAEEVLERGHGLEVARVDLEQLPPGVDGVVGLVERRLVDRAELAVERDEVLGRQHGGGAVHRLVEGGDDLLRIVAPAQDLRDRVERVDVAVLDVEHAVVVVERGVVAAELLHEELGAAEEDLHPGHVVGGDVVVPLEDLAELGPLAEALVEIGEGGEGLLSPRRAARGPASRSRSRRGRRRG